jgi:hypothetical protein
MIYQIKKNDLFDLLFLEIQNHTYVLKSAKIHHLNFNFF